jgi:hypothetical protein
MASRRDTGHRQSQCTARLPTGAAWQVCKRTGHDIVLRIVPGRSKVTVDSTDHAG